MLEEYSKNASIDSSNIDYRKTTVRNTDWFDFMNDNRVIQYKYLRMFSVFLKISNQIFVIMMFLTIS